MQNRALIQDPLDAGNDAGAGHSGRSRTAAVVDFGQEPIDTGNYTTKPVATAVIFLLFCC